MAVSAHRLKATARTDGRVAERLDGASRAIDGHFLGLGEILGQSVEGLGKLVASLDQIQGTLDPQLIAATTSELEAAARELLSLPDRHAERSGGARRLASTAERLAISIDDMRRTLAYLRVFAINIKITAGGIATAGREFGDFAQEISDCIELGRARLDKFEADLVRLRGGFKAAFAQEQAVTARFGGLLPAVPDGLTANAAAMVTHHQRIGQVAGEVATLARAVQKKTGAALGGLQVGDITRQRIEHVSEALAMLADVTGLSDDQAARMKTVIHGLLDAQLQAASEDFHNDVARISQAMAGLSADAREILRLRDVAQGRAGDDDRGFLHRIEAHLAQAQDLVADVGEADRQAAMLGASVSAAAIDLSAQIAALRTIKTDVQYMALNTTLKCGRLGDVGKPLAVIATELRLHAGAMDTAAQQALNALNALIEDAAHLSGAQSDPSETVSQSVGESLSQVALRLRTAGEQVDADLAEVAREGDSVVQGLDRAKSKMRFDDEIGAILEDAAADLAADVNDGAVDTDDLAEPLAELLARIAKRYTMKQERDVHQRMTGGLGLIAKSEAA
jgi:uncharacterized protein YdbL (DUF1318 family)